MQLIESSSLGLRSARHRLASPGSRLSVTLFPMVHIGESAFYEKVYSDAFGHDVVLVEGVDGAVVRHLTRSYRWVAGSRLGLVVQPRYPAAEAVPARIVRADLPADAFRREWRRIPLWLRLLVFLAVPIVGLRLRWFASRESIAKHLDMDDYRSREETLGWNPASVALRRGILDSRDARLIECLGAELDREDPGGNRLAVLFGARHMRAVLLELKRRGFRSVDSHWETVFWLD